MTCQNNVALKQTFCPNRALQYADHNRMTLKALETFIPARNQCATWGEMFISRLVHVRTS